MTEQPGFTLPNFSSFDEAYIGTPPWEIGRPQPAMLELFDAGEVAGEVLDVGCGTGELALLAGARGLSATGVDSSPRAIAIARRRASERGLEGVRFEVGDALDLSFLPTRFDTVVDSGVMHAFNDVDRARYLESVRTALVPGGRYHLLVFSDEQPGSWGPRRVSRRELETAFSRGWRALHVQPAQFELTEGNARAWRASVTRDGAGGAV